MVRGSLITIAARVAVTLLNLAVVVMAGHTLGATGLGDISLVVLGITLVLLVGQIAGGGALVYLQPRYPLSRLLPPAYGWVLLTGALAAWILPMTGGVPEGTALHVALLAMLQAICSIHFNVLLGLQRLRLYNLFSVLQAAVLAITFFFLLRGAHQPSVLNYVQAAYVAHGTISLLSLLPVLAAGKRSPGLPANGPLLTMLFRQGALIQGANLLQLLNYRLAYYLLDHFSGRISLGIYSVGNQLAEGAWIGPKALGTVLYGRVSNLLDDRESAQRTITALHLALALAMLVLLVLLLIPDHLFGVVFSKEVWGVRKVLVCLAPGILAMAASQAFSHYFSGTGRNRHNVIGSGLGLVVTAIAGWSLIPHMGMVGAAITASLAYLANSIYQGVRFMSLTGLQMRDLSPRWRDAREFLTGSLGLRRD